MLVKQYMADWSQSPSESDADVTLVRIAKKVIRCDFREIIEFLPPQVG
jgi:hypothetical protein